MIRYCYITLTFVLLSHLLLAQFGNIEFIENKGQWDKDIKFKSDVASGTFFIRAGGFTVLQHNNQDLQKYYEITRGHYFTPDEKNPSFTLHSHAYKVDFAGASESFEIIPDKPQTYYTNYFIGNDPAKWASECKVYQGITLKNIYPNIDVRYYSEAGTMKYDLIVKPGGDVRNIVLKYSGADKLELKNNELHVKTSVGNVKELNPYTYQFSNNQRRKISCNYLLKGNEVRFDVKNYNPNEVLIIDPTLIFVSFSGSTGDNWGFTATYGPDGSFYGGGIAQWNF